MEATLNYLRRYHFKNQWNPQVNFISQIDPPRITQNDLAEEQVAAMTRLTLNPVLIDMLNNFLKKRNQSYTPLPYQHVLTLDELIRLLDQLKTQWETNYREGSQSKIATLIPIMYRANLIPYIADQQLHLPECERIFMPHLISKDGKGFRDATRFGVLMNELIQRHPITKDFSKELMLIQELPINVNSPVSTRHLWDYGIPFLKYCIEYNEANAGNHVLNSKNEKFKISVEIFTDNFGERFIQEANKHAEISCTIKNFFQSVFIPQIVGAIANLKSNDESQTKFRQRFLSNFILHQVENLRNQKIAQLNEFSSNNLQESKIKEIELASYQNNSPIIQTLAKHCADMDDYIPVNIIAKLIAIGRNENHSVLQQLKQVVKCSLAPIQYKITEDALYVSFDGALTVLLSKSAQANLPQKNLLEVARNLHYMKEAYQMLVELMRDFHNNYRKKHREGSKEFGKKYQQVLDKLLSMEKQKTLSIQNDIDRLKEISTRKAKQWQKN